MTDSPRDPRLEYELRLDTLRKAEVQHRSRDRAFVTAKLSLVVLTVLISGWLVKFHPQGLFFLVVPFVAFLLLVIYHERLLRALRYGGRLVAYYEQGLARLNGEWIGKGNTGDQFLDPAHPYARDLDIFGEGSLFELLCLARTRGGEQLLADWLSAPAGVEEVKARQGAVRDLRNRLNFREALASAGEDARLGVHPEALVSWSQFSAVPGPKWLRGVLLLLAFVWVLSLVGWLGFDLGWPALLVSAINALITYRLHRRLDEAVGHMEQAGHDLEILSGVLAGIEAEPFSSERMQALQDTLKTHGIPPSVAIRKLEKRVDWLLSRDNWFVRILDLFIFWTPQCVFALDRWREEYGVGIPTWLATVAEIEALASLAGYAFEHPEDAFPEFVAEGPYLEVQGMTHPFLPRDRAVTNDLKLEENGLRLVMISGPNMAGKSTFLRGLGVNVVLAEAGAPVRAAKMCLSPLAVAASICVLDSLQGGLSRFYAEIKRLKLISDMSGGGMPVLYLFDELLSGTNSHDRRVGTESVLRHMVENHAVGLVTTHDLALTKIAESIGDHVANFHFSDTFEDGKLHFDYKLHPGVVHTTNALALMRSIGLKV